MLSLMFFDLKAWYFRISHRKLVLWSPKYLKVESISQQLHHVSPSWDCTVWYYLISASYQRWLLRRGKCFCNCNAFFIVQRICHRMKTNRLSNFSVLIICITNAGHVCSWNCYERCFASEIFIQIKKIGVGIGGWETTWITTSYQNIWSSKLALMLGRWFMSPDIYQSAAAHPKI